METRIDKKNSGNGSSAQFGEKLKRSDALRLIQEGVEELSEWTGELDRVGTIRLLREVIRAGVAAVKAARQTVSLQEAAWSSIEARSDLRAVSLRDLRHYVRRILRVEGAAGMPLRAMSTGDCRRILDAAFGCSRSSYVKGRAVLSSIFSHGIRREWCDSNPVARIEVPKVREQEKAPLAAPQVQQLLSTANKPEFRDMRFSVRLLLYSGIRPAEVARLRAEDVCWQEKQIIIRPQVSKTGGGRYVPLRCMQGLRKQDCRIPANWKKRWKALRRAAGFTRWVPDVCRHTFASYHAAYFRNLPQLQLEMGHRDVNLLRSRYVSPALSHAAATFWSGKRESLKTQNESKN